MGTHCFKDETDFRCLQMTSLVMVDTKQYPRRNGLSSFDERVSLLTNVEKSCSPRKICSCARCKRVIYNHAVKPRFIGYTNINPLLVDHLTEHQYFLCDEAVEAFVYKTRTWSMLFQIFCPSAD